MRAGLLLLLGVLSGCASALPEDVIEYNRGVALDNWSRCEALINNAGVNTIHVDHIHHALRSDRLHVVRADLRDNRCRRLLGRDWLEDIGT